MCRVLIVDEQPMIRELVAEVLAQRGHEALCAATEDEALVLMERGEVEVIVMHPSHGGEDALALLRRLEDDPRLAAAPIPVLLVSDMEGADPEPLDACEIKRIDGSCFRVADLLMRLDECLGVRAGELEERRSAFRVRTTSHDISAHIDGQGPWQVVDVSAEGLGVVAEMEAEVGAGVRVVLREGETLWEGRMRVRNRIDRRCGLVRYGLQVAERTSQLGRALERVSMRLQREYLQIRSARA